MMDSEPGRILAVDPGQKRLGLAVSDPTRTIAGPLMVLAHQSRKKDAAEILRIAEEQNATLIIIGLPLHWDGSESHQARSSRKLADHLREAGSIPVEFADEFGTTQAAQEVGLKLDLSRNRRSGHMDDMAAAIILQNYLDKHTGKLTP